MPYVLEIAKALNCEVVLVMTYSMPQGSHAFAKRLYVPYTDKLAESVEKDARTYLDGKAQELKAKGMGSAFYRLMQGPSAIDMIDLARKAPDNMLATYTSRTSRLGRFGIGNVTNRIMRQWHNPVLVVRA